MRRRANSLPLEALQPYLLASQPSETPLSWPAVFGNAGPVELEVGFGKGAFLVASALSRPEINFVGLEVDRGLLLYVANRLAKRRLANARLVQADAGVFFSRQVASGSLAAIHVYFPDPWWKRRHRKRRVFTAAFVAECGRCLRPGGLLHVASDVPEYFAAMQKLLAARPELAPAAIEHESAATSNFERKAIASGRLIQRATYQRVDEPVAAPGRT